MQKLKIAHEAEIDLLQINFHRWVSATNVPQKFLIDQLQVYFASRVPPVAIHDM